MEKLNRLVILPGAIQETAEGFRWYEQQRPGLGSEFLCCLDERIQVIQHFPDMYEVIYKDYHRALLLRFPYAIIYRVERNLIVIYSVFHCSQNPAKLRRKLR